MVAGAGDSNFPSFLLLHPLAVFFFFLTSYKITYYKLLVTEREEDFNYTRLKSILLVKQCFMFVLRVRDDYKVKR